MSPQHQVPVLNDNGFYLSESRAIMRYLVNKHAPESSMYPKEPTERARVDRILDFDCSTLSGCIKDAIFKPAIFKKVPTEEQKENLKDALKILNEYLSRTSYVACDHLTIADLSIFGLTTLSEKVDFDFSPYPKIASWMEKLKKELPYHKELNEDPINQALEKLKKMNLEKK